MKIHLYIHRRPNFRSVKWMARMTAGFELFHSLFDKGDIVEDETLQTYFPEKMINLAEQAVLFARFAAQAPKLKKIEIHTHSPLLTKAAMDAGAEVFFVAEDGVTDENISTVLAEPYAEEDLSFEPK